MPEKLLFCADNLFDIEQYPQHVVSGQEEATGFEAFRVASGRRQPGDAWRATTANTDRYLRVLCDQLRGADFVAIDRGSNHIDRTISPPSGKRFQLEQSGDNFATAGVQVFDANPIAAVPGGVISGAMGACSNEFAWLKTFTPDGSYAWQLISKAMGANVVVSLTNVMLGKAWQPSEFLLFLPTQDRTYAVKQPRSESPYGWVGRGRAVRKRQGTLVIKPASEADFDFIEWQVLGLYARGFPAWIIHDKVDGSRDAFMACCPDTELDFGRKMDWPNRGLVIPFEEDQPAL